MKSFSELLAQLLLLVWWLAGIVLAKGFWSTVCAIFIPPWAFYLVVEKLMERVL